MVFTVFSLDDRFAPPSVKYSTHSLSESAISGSSIEVAEPEKEVEVNAQVLSDDFYFTTVNETIKGSRFVTSLLNISMVDQQTANI